MDDRDAQERVARVEGLLEEVETLADPKARQTATELVGALLDLYGEGLERVLTLAGQRGGDGVPEALAEDDLVSHLLLLHGLHPVPVEQRVVEALDSVRPYLESHGGDVEVLGVADGVARVRLEGSCSGCPSSAMTLKLAIEEAIHKAAPDVESVEAEGVTPEAVPAPAPQLMQIEVTPSGGSNGDSQSANGPPSWTSVGALSGLAPDRATARDVSGEPLLFLRVDEAPYAYRPTCPGCESSLDGAPVRNAELACPECGNRYDARRAGRCLDAPALHLEPVPLLEGDDGLVKVALAAGARA